MYNKILSISVAMYNLEKLISKNIQSFINSEVVDLIEVIVTDDGSKDSSAEIVKEYEDKYPNTIKLIKQCNQGPGSTVNSGINNATGKYFMMVDGDDWVNSKNLSKLIKNLSEIDTDMVVLDYQVYSEKTNKIINTICPKLPNNKELKFDSICKNLTLAMHSTIYKTNLLKNNNIVIDNCFYTDVEYLLYPIPYVNTVIYYNFPIYVYRIGRNEQSVNIKSLQKNIEMHNFVLNNLLEFYEKNEPKILDNTKKFIAYRIMEMTSSQITILLSFDNDKEKRKKVKSFIYKIKKDNTDIFYLLKKTLKFKLLKYTNYYSVNLLGKIINIRHN